MEITVDHANARCSVLTCLGEVNCFGCVTILAAPVDYSSETHEIEGQVLVRNVCHLSLRYEHAFLPLLDTQF